MIQLTFDAERLFEVAAIAAPGVGLAERLVKGGASSLLTKMRFVFTRMPPLKS